MLVGTVLELPYADSALFCIRGKKLPNKRCEMSDGVFAAAAKPAVSERRFIMLVTHIVKKDQPTKSIEREGRGLLNVATDLVGYCGDSIIAFRKRRLVCDFLVVLFRRSLLDRRDVVLFVAAQRR